MINEKIITNNVYFHKKPTKQGDDLVIIIPRAMKHLFDGKRVLVVRDDLNTH